MNYFSTFIQKAPRLFWIEVIIIVILAILTLYSSKKQGLFFSLQFFLPGLAWGVARGLLYFFWHYESSPGTFINFQKISFLLIVGSIIIWFFSLILSKKLAGNVIYDKNWSKKFLFTFFLITLGLQLLFDYYIYSSGYIRIRISLSGKFLTIWPYLQSLILTIEALVFIWAVRHAKYFTNKRHQGILYCSAVSFLYLPLVWLTGLFFLGVFNTFFRLLF